MRGIHGAVGVVSGEGGGQKAAWRTGSEAEGKVNERCLQTDLGSGPHFLSP